MSLLLSTGAFASSLSGADPGMVLMKPTSIAHTGTSATLGANGQVTFSAVSVLSLNGCFTADFDNYVISTSHSGPSNTDVQLFLRASGTDESATSFIRQTLFADNTSVSANRGTGLAFVGFNAGGTSGPNAAEVHLYGPFIAAPTAGRAITVSSLGTVRIFDNAFTHSESTSYDGFTIKSQDTSSMTGALQVYGVRS